MWASAGTNRWTRAEGYLLVDGDTMLELHGDTLHTYRLDPKADKSTFAGSPLDGYVWQSTAPAPSGNSTPALPDPTTAWRLLGDRAALIAAARAAGGGRVTA